MQQTLVISALCFLVGNIVGWVARSFCRSYHMSRVKTFQFKDVLPDKEHRAHDLVLENYKDCRSLLQKNIDIMERNETYVIGAIAAVITFGLGQKDQTFLFSQAILVLLLAVVGTYRWNGLRHVIHISDDYCRKIEENFPVTGWATYYEAHRLGKLGRSREVFWAAVVICSIIWAVVCWRWPSVVMQKDSASVSASVEILGPPLLHVHSGG